MSSAPSPPQQQPANSSLAVEPFVLTLPDDSASGQDWLLWAGVLVLLVFLVFFPAVTGTFLWDDDHHPGVISAYPTASGLAQIWTEQRATPQYYPLTYTSYWLEYQLWKENPLGYHIDNLILHALSAVLVWRLLRRLKLPGAWIAAAIWAIHPLQAESVCWISERKNVLSGLLFFASLWFYTEFSGLAPPAAKPSPGLSADGSTYLLGNRWAAYAASLALFVLALLAKTVVCALPVVCIILLWWKRKFSFKTLAPLVPYFLAGLLLAFVTVYLETQPGGNVQANGPDWAITPIQRILIAGRGLWFYVGKLIWPGSLSFVYSRLLPTPADWLYVLATILTLAILWTGRNSWSRGALAAVGYYGVTLVPSLGFINIFPMRYTFVANHYQYLSGLGLIVLAVSAIASVASRLPGMILAILAIAGFSAQGWLTASVFQSSERLWRDTLAKTPDAWMAADNLGIELIRLSQVSRQNATSDAAQGDTDSAQADRKAAQADLDEAEKMFHRALALRPTNFSTYNGLGVVARIEGRWLDAEDDFARAVVLDRQDSKYHQVVAPYINYAQVLMHNHPDADVKLHPEWDPLPWFNAALALADYRRADAKDLAGAQMVTGDYWFNLAATASRAGKTDQEVADLKQAIGELQLSRHVLPDETLTNFDLGRAWQRLGVIDQNDADQARAAGQRDKAAQLQQQSLFVDDANAMQAYSDMLTAAPHAGAMEGMGELWVHQTLQSDSQYEAISAMLKATEYFIGSITVDHNVSGARSNLAAMEQRFLQEADKARQHAQTWAPLRAKLAAISSGPFKPADAEAADAALHDALWPLAKTDPLRQPLENLHWAIRDAVGASPAANAVSTLQSQVSAVLAALKTRDAAHDAAADLAETALCYACALTADPHSAAAWTDLKSTADQLAASKQLADFQTDLARARTVLDEYAPATQPAPARPPAPSR
ncbi:MAG TPA: hypothetical protein VL992_21045 [Tepidisphaeraceae bacterium]|nr:hypothetical protein [Tepidisphaeraceae bacterium]